MNLPTKLTLLRIFMIPVFVVIFFLDVIPYNFVISAGVFLLAAFTDFLDGYIARKYNMVTDLGKFLDPIADKVLVSTAFIIMLVPVGDVTIIPGLGAIAVAIIIARELVVSGFRMVAASKGMVIAADVSGKIKTFVQDVAIVVLLVSADLFALTEIVHTVIYYIGLGLLGVATVLTIVSGTECIVKNRRVLK